MKPCETPISLEKMPGFLIADTSYLLRKYLICQLKQDQQDYGLTLAELPLIARIAEHPNILQTELIVLTLKDKTTVTRLLDSLEKKQLIIRQTDPDDGRARRICLSKQGKQLKAFMLQKAQIAAQQFTHDISDEDLQTTLNTLQKLNSKLRHVML